MPIVDDSDGSGTGVAGLVSLTNKGHVEAQSGPQEWTVHPSLFRIARMATNVHVRARLMDQVVRHEDEDLVGAMLTSTYADVDGWRADHIKVLHKHLRQYCQRHGFDFRCVWVAELQRRGAVHYHDIIWLPRGVKLPMPDKQGWWPHGSTRIEFANSAVGYLAKYASKAEGIVKFPRGLRMHGACGLNAEARAINRYCLLPSYVRSRCEIGTDIIRAPGGGFINRDTGEFIPAKWKFAGRLRDGRIKLVEVENENEER